MINYITIIIPSIIGYGTALACKMGKDSGKSVKFRPPPWVFGVVWPILYLMLGISWFIALRDSKDNKILINVLYTMLSLLLGLWIIIYSCNKNKYGAVFVLLLSVMVCFGLFAIGNVISKLLIAPLLGWLIFATIMNVTEVQYS